jgi:CheY-like chemotaxis protein
MLPILVVDDNPQIRSLVKKLLSLQGFQVIEAHDGPTGLAELRKTGGAVGAVLTDLEMDGMSGVDLANAIASEFPSIPILLMSASEISEEELRTRVPSFASFLRKPFDPRKLVSVLQKASGRFLT